MDERAPTLALLSVLWALGSDQTNCPVRVASSGEPQHFSGTLTVTGMAQENTTPTPVRLEVRKLIEQTSSPNRRVRASAARELGMIGERAKAAVPCLIRLLNDSDRPSPQEFSPRTWAYSAIKKIGPSAVGPLVEALKDKNPKCRRQAAFLLGEIGDDLAVEPVIALLEDEDRHVQYAGIRALGDLADDRAVSPLIACMNEQRNHDLVRCRATWVLGMFRDPRVVEALTARLEDEEENRSVRYQAAASLGCAGDRDVVDTLLAMSHHKDHRVRRGVFWGLAQFDDARVVARQLKAVKDKLSTVGVRRAAAIGLGHSKHRRSIEFLLAVVDDKTEDMEVRKSALAALSFCEDAQGEGRVFAALQEPVPLAFVAALTVRRMENPEAVGPLLKALEHENCNVRRLAADALGERKERRALEPLKTLLDDKGPYVAHSSKRAIASIRGTPWNELDELPWGQVPWTVGDDGLAWGKLFGPLAEPYLKVRLLSGQKTRPTFKRSELRRFPRLSLPGLWPNLVRLPHGTSGTRRTGCTLWTS